MGIMAAKLIAVSTAALAVSGCATYTARAPQLVYYAVPCSTPGAFQAQLSPVPPKGTGGATPGSASQSVDGHASAGPAPTCLVATQIDSRGYANGYGGYGPYYGYAGGYFSPYYGHGGYDHPFYGSVGIRLHGSGGGHGRGGHGGGHGTH